MAFTRTLFLLVALVLLQGVLSMPSRRRQQQQEEGQGRGGGRRGSSSSSEEEGKDFFDICRIVNQTVTLCMEDSECPANSVCTQDFMDDSLQYWSCLPQTCVTTATCPTGTNCTELEDHDGTTQSYCLPEDFEDYEDSGSWESDFDGAFDGAFDGTYDGAYGDAAYAGGAYDDGWDQFLGGFFGRRRKRQVMESCNRVLCRIHNQGRGGRDDGGSEGGRGGRGGDDGQGGRGGNGGFFPRQTTPGQDQPQLPDQTTPGQNQPLFPGQNPGQNPGVVPLFGQPQSNSRRGGRQRGQRRQGGTMP